MILEVKVFANSGKSQWLLDKNGTLRCYVKNPPERGLANQEVVKSLAKALKISTEYIEIVSGFSSPRKRLKINLSLSYEDIIQRLGLERQTTL